MSIALLLILPFTGAIATFIIGKISKKYAFVFAEIIGFILFALVVNSFFSYTKPIDIPLDWFTFGDITIPFGIYIDHLSLVMLLIATGLGALDIHFSHDYMKEDPDQARYYAKILFFIGGMILLVSAKELLGLFVGWEFMGLASYLLISFWHQNKAPADAGVTAFLYTKFGDIFLFAAMGLLLYFTGTLDLQKINLLASQNQIASSVSFTIAIFIFIAAIGKSGQFPLFPWLMRAMEGPTTVSALIHGATMVNSGIYVVARLFDFYEASQALIVVAAVASLSAFIGATSALVQSEIKKVLAYSTMSHLSLAFIGLGVGSLSAGMTHLTNHAVFKALLFLGAGAVIMSARHNKELFKLGGAYKKLTLVAIFMAMGALSLSGIPPFSGFYSKDAIIATSLLNPQTYGLISTLTIIAGVLSVAYIFRLWLLIFAGKPQDIELNKVITTPSKFWISLPLGIMAFATLILGFYQEELSNYITGEEIQEAHLPYLPFALLSAIFIVAFIVYKFYKSRPNLRDKLAAQPLMKAIHKVLFNGYFIEHMITWFVKNIVINSISKTINWVDINIIDKAVNNMLNISQKIFLLLSKTTTSKVSNQAGIMLIGIFSLLIILFVGSLI
ncbi:MAG: NADH-quinone oxidoreductase subunit L [Sulfurimonas sp.]